MKKNKSTASSSNMITTAKSFVAVQGERPGDRIRIEEYRFSAENCVASSCLPPGDPDTQWLTRVVAIDVATNYIVAMTVSLGPCDRDAFNLVAMMMRDKTLLAQRFGEYSWKGWCKPKVIEVAEGSFFASSKVKARLSDLDISIECKTRTDIQSVPARRLSELTFVSGDVVKRMRHERPVDPTLGMLEESVRDFSGLKYLRTAIEHEFLRAICTDLQDATSIAGKRRLKDFMGSRTRRKPPTDHQLRVMICDEEEGPVIQDAGIHVWGHPYHCDALEKLWEAIDMEPTCIKVGDWNVDSISVRGVDGKWFEVAGYDEDVPAQLAREEIEFAEIMANNSRLANRDRRVDQYYKCLDWLRQPHLPIFDFFTVYSRDSEDFWAFTLGDVVRAKRPGELVQIEAFTLDLSHHTPGYVALGTQDAVTVYLAVDVATGYVLSLKATDVPNEEAALDLISRMMHDRNDMSWEVSAGDWPGLVRPKCLVNASSVFMSERVKEAIARLGFRSKDVITNVGIDLASLLKDEVLVGGNDIDLLERALVRVVCGGYNNTPQPMLGDRTPLRAFTEDFDNDPTFEPRSTEVMRQALGHEFRAVITEEGVTVEGELYNSEHLQEMRLTLAGVPARFRFDPMSMGEISVHSPNRGEPRVPLWQNWESVPSVAGIPMTRSLEALRDIREIMAQKDNPLPGSKPGIDSAHALERIIH